MTFEEVAEAIQLMEFGEDVLAVKLRAMQDGEIYYPPTSFDDLTFGMDWIFNLVCYEREMPSELVLQWQAHAREMMRGL